MKETRSDIRMSEEMRKAIDQWRKLQEEIPSRSEAVRTLVEVGLHVLSREPTPPKRTTTTPGKT